MNKPLTVLFDYDSMIYKAVTHIVDRDGVRQWFNDGRSREWMEKEIVNLTINRLEQMGNHIFQAIEDTGIEIGGVEYFLTACKNSIRKAASPIYKANRKRNKWVSLIRKELLSMGFASVHDKWEADDLIKDRAIDLGVDGCVILSIDKDLKQIPGIHFDYFEPNLKDIDGNQVYNERRWRVKAPYRGLEIVTEQAANTFYWAQVMAGDSGDNIKGIPMVGLKTAYRLLALSSDYEKTAQEKYFEKFGNKGEEQFNLHRLLIGLGITHRK